MTAGKDAAFAAVDLAADAADRPASPAVNAAGRTAKRSVRQGAGMKLLQGDVGQVIASMRGGAIRGKHISDLAARVGVTQEFLLSQLRLPKSRFPAAVWRQREVVDVATLAATWQAAPAGSTTLDIGDAWLRANAAPLLLLPSVTVPEERNVLINPRHPAAARLRAAVVRQHVYDPRL